MKKNVLSVVFSCVLSLFMAVCLIAAALSVVAKEIVCKPDVLLDAAKTSGFYTELYDQIKYKWENLLSITGIEETEPFVELLTSEMVEEHAELYLRTSYSAVEYGDAQSVRDALEEKVREYAYSHNIYATPESELEQNISDLVTACMADYDQAIRMPLVPKLLSAAASGYRYLNLAAPILAAVALALSVFLFFLQRKRLDTLYYAAISAATGAVLLLGLMALVTYRDVVHRLPFEASAMKTLVVAFAQRIVDALYGWGYLFLIAAAVLILPYLIVMLVRFLKKRAAKKAA